MDKKNPYLREIIREEVRKIVENDDKREVMDNNLEKVDEIRKKIGKLQLELHDQGFEGYFTHGDAEKLDQKIKTIRENLKEIEGIIINERGRS